MGMPGLETALEEMMCRILEDFIQEGCVAKLADNLYCGGNTPEARLNNWRQVLKTLDHCNLHLSLRILSFVPGLPPPLAGYGPKAVYQLALTVSSS